jgi:hypothetical protein
VIERVADALKRTGQMMRLATVTPATIRHSSIDDAFGGWYNGRCVRESRSGCRASCASYGAAPPSAVKRRNAQVSPKAAEALQRPSR